MKKTIIASVMALATLAAGAKTADELRVYINPGHFESAIAIVSKR